MTAGPRQAAALMAALLLAGSARGADIATQCGKTCVISITGPIADGDAKTFREAAAAHSVAVVALAGPGGKVVPALAIGSDIRARGWRTLVPADASCASACALIWLAGAQRLLGVNARIGFHALSIPQPGATPAETHAFDMTLVHYLTALGYAYDVTATIVTTPSSMVHWRDAIELNANGIATQTYP